MERRKFLKGGVLLLSAPTALPSTQRLFGKPASIEPRDIPDLDKFKLPLSRAEVPTELWDSLAKLCQIWENVLTDNAEAEVFYSNPSLYFSSLGLDSSDQVLISESVMMLKAAVDPVVKEGLKDGNYAVIYDRFIQLGLLKKNSPSLLQKKIEQIFRANIEDLRASVMNLSSRFSGMQQQTLSSALDDAGLVTTSDELLVISQLLSQGSGSGDVQPVCTAIAMCVVAVGIAATVVAYVSVVTTATVAILAGVYVSAAVQVAITAGGGGCRKCVPYEVPVPMSAPFKGEYLKLDPVEFRNTERALRLAGIIGNNDLQADVMRSALKNEIDAVLAAMKSVGLLDISEESLPKVAEVVARYSWKTLGIDRPSTRPALEGSP